MNSTASQERTYAEHNLPMLRVHRAAQRAAEIAEAYEVDGKVVDAIVREVIGIIGEGTFRRGHRCPECRQEIHWSNTTIDQYPVCPEHGTLDRHAPLILMVAFPPCEPGQ